MGVAATTTDASVAATAASLNEALERRKRIDELLKSTGESLAQIARLKDSTQRLWDSRPQRLDATEQGVQAVTPASSTTRPLFLAPTICPTSSMQEKYQLSAQQVFDERSERHEGTTSNVLHVTVTCVLYPMTEKVLLQVFDPYGVNEICVLQQSTHVKAFVEFQSWREAVKARHALHDRCIYDDCCCMSIQYASPSVLVDAPRPSTTLKDKFSSHASSELGLMEVPQPAPMPSVMHPMPAVMHPVSSSPLVAPSFSKHDGCDSVSPTQTQAVCAAPQVLATFHDKEDSKLTCVSGSSFFPELDIDSANKLFEDEVLITVGGVSLFLELDMDYDAEVLTHVGGLSLFLEQITDTHHELDGEIDKSTCLDHGVGGVQVVSLVVPSAESKLQQLLSSEMQPGTDMATLFLPWDPDVWIIVAEIPFLSTARTSDMRRLGQNLEMFHEDIFIMKLNEKLSLQVTQLATQFWDPGIPRLITTTTISLYNELTACLIHLLVGQWGKNQSALGYVFLPPFSCDVWLGCCWEHMLDGKQSWNQDGFNIFVTKSACCILVVDKVSRWRQSAFSPGKDEQHCFNSELHWTTARNCSKVALPTLPFRSELADYSASTFRMLGIQLDPIQSSGPDRGHSTSDIKQWKVPCQDKGLGVQYGDQLEILRCYSGQLVLCLNETWAWLDGSTHAAGQHASLNLSPAHMCHFDIPYVFSWAEERGTLQGIHENYQLWDLSSCSSSRVYIEKDKPCNPMNSTFFSKKSSSHLRGLSMPWDPSGLDETSIPQAIAWGQAIFCGAGSVTPLPGGILGLSDLGRGPAALGFRIFGYKKRAAGTIGTWNRNRTELRLLLSTCFFFLWSDLLLQV